MVIQRWQTLLLLIAVVMMCIFCATPFATIPAADAASAAVYAKDAPVLLTVNILIAVLLFIAIFLYKNLKRQMTVTLVSMVLLCASLVTCGLILTVSMPDAEPVWFGGIVLLVASLVVAYAAYRLMRRDKNLLSSYDRLR